MRISWGTKIAILYTGFVVMILALVSATFLHKNELVTEAYYQQETTFQKQLDATRAASALKEPLRLTADARTLTLTFPERFSGMPLSGTVRFYAPSKAAADRTFQIAALTTRHWTLARTQLVSIAYEVQVSWTAAGTDYYQTLPLQLQ